MVNEVQVGDTILVTKAAIDAKKKVTVEWSQGARPRSEDYYDASFIIAVSKSGGATGPTTRARIFIQESLVPGFIEKAVKDKEEYTVVVDAAFQYGDRGEKGAPGRFLVFHDKEHKPFQFRFVLGLALELLEKAAGIFKQFGYESPKALIEDYLKVGGKYLLDFPL